MPKSWLLSPLAGTELELQGKGWVGFHNNYSESEGLEGTEQGGDAGEHHRGTWKIYAQE